MSGAAGGWGGGYVTDVPYVPGYYRHQSPLHLDLACLVAGFAGLGLRAGMPLSYVELGCGQGFGALALAVCNPSWRITAIDFNPAHIAAARELAAEAGLDNVAFIEADLAVLADRPQASEIPTADVASLHGLWSWVADPVRAGIVRLLAAIIRPGGVVHVSYNALPAWQGALGMQRLVSEVARRLAMPSDRKAAAGIEIVSALAAGDIRHLSGVPFVHSLLEHAKNGNTAYLAHEYLNDGWRPCFHADLAAAMAEAKLDWVASAELHENFPELTLPDAAREATARFGDPIFRELVKDLCLSRGLRRDVFVRGARRLATEQRDAALGETVLGLLCPESEFRWEFEVATGKAALDREFFGPIVAALASGPQRVRDLLELPDLPRRGNPAELVGMLVGTDQVLPLLAAPGEPDARAAMFNRVAARHLVRRDNLDGSIAMATSGTGAALPCTMLDLFVAARLENDAIPDPAGWAEMLGPGQPESERQRLREFIDRLIAERAALWRQLGAPLAHSPPPP